MKRSVTREAAESLHPEAARELIRVGVRDALAGLGSVRPVQVPGVLEVDLLTADQATQATWVRGVERAGERTVSIATTEPLSAYRAFVAVIAITRGLGAV